MPHAPAPVLHLERCTLRPWHVDDAASFARHADDREVWRNMRDVFPHPCAAEHAQRWLERACAAEAGRAFAIEVEGEAVGEIGITPLTDVHRRTGELFYWLGRAVWNRGIATEVVRAFTEHAFTVLDLVRVQATVYEWNPASMRVLEKCGYERESTKRRAALKDGRFVDCIEYARLRGD